VRAPLGVTTKLLLLNVPLLVATGVHVLIAAFAATDFKST
jgi:hypothetical protein